MPVGELIAAAVGLILIIVVAYVLVGSTIGTAETMASAQRDMTHLQEIRLHTDITVMSASGSPQTNPEIVNFGVANNGSVTINNRDFENMDVIIINQSEYYPPYYYTNSSGSVIWDSPPTSFNPGDTLNGTVLSTNQPVCTGSYWIEVVTVNGVTSLAPITC
jgi:flagellar protein FlaF